ncbi:hypothetical protein GCM10020000_77770 [Streptomyces olivoverticillatus]
MRTSTTAGSATGPSSRKGLCKRPLGQGKRNFDMARSGGYLQPGLRRSPTVAQGFLQAVNGLFELPIV